MNTGIFTHKRQVVTLTLNGRAIATYNVLKDAEASMRHLIENGYKNLALN